MRKKKKIITIFISIGTALLGNLEMIVEFGYQRFGEGLRIATDKLNGKNFYAFNPAFDKNCK